jgi:FAD/FMN-containing dehydrogenase
MRSASKQAPVGDLGFGEGSPLASPGGAASSGAIEWVKPKDAWLLQRTYCLSGNRLLRTSSDGSIPSTTYARQVYRPRSAQEIAELVRSVPASIAIACVGGGHESSNAAMFASSEAIVLDLAHLKSIDFHQDGERSLVTVGAGVVFRELVEAVRGRQAALPVGTGPDVGVVGYIVNGGLSGYFSRRLGLLGQRVVRLTMVTAEGDIRVLTPEDDLFIAMLGAGSALGIVVDVTILMAPESILQSAEQRVVAYETREQAVAFARGALRIQRESALPNDSVSMELVVTGTKALVITTVFYDAFQGNTADFVKPIEDLAASLNLSIVLKSHWSTWYEAAIALWPVIAEMKGSPLGMLQHCMGTNGPPTDAVLDFICDTVVAEAPLDQAQFSIVEIRTLGGAVLSQSELPTGNCHHQFFVDLITLYDAKAKTVAERQEIATLTQRVMEKARHVDGLSVDFSGTHSQPDDVDASVSASMIFGTQAMADTVRRLKTMVDPANRFRFHPFAKLFD